MSGPISSIVEALVVAGASPEMILAAVKASEANNADALTKRRASDAARQAKKRGAKSASHVTSRDVTVTVCDSPSLSPSPEPLSTIPTQLPPIVPQKVDVSQLAERLWSLANPDGRERSGKSAVRKAVSAALARGATPDQLEADVRRHYAEADRGKRDNAGKTFAKGLHRRIEGDHWSGCKPADPAKPLEPVTPEIQARRLQHLRDTGEWKPIWGTPPEVGRLEPFRPMLVTAA